MGKQEVLDFLEKYPNRWFSSKEIAGLGNSRTISSNLSRIYKSVVERNMHCLERRASIITMNGMGYDWRITKEYPKQHKRRWGE